MQSPFGGLLEDGDACNMPKTDDCISNGSSARARRSLSARGSHAKHIFCPQLLVYKRISMKFQGIVEYVVRYKMGLCGSKIIPLEGMGRGDRKDV
jgi:hypothetical protein